MLDFLFLLIYLMKKSFLPFLGYFTYIEASRPRKYGDRATLISPIVRAKEGCLVFWYHMRGSSIGQLRLYFSTALASHVMFEKNGEKGRDWLLAKIDVNPSWGTSSGYKVCDLFCYFIY